MKIVKTILFIIWGFITFGFFILALIQRQDALKSHDYAIERQKELLNATVEMQEEYQRNMELLSKNSTNRNTIDSIYKSSQFLKTLTGEKIGFEIKNNPKEFQTNEKYWIKLKVENTNKEKIAVTSNNGKIFKSEIEGYDYMFIPKKIGELKLEVYDRGVNTRLCGEMKINVTSNARK
jgi:hypothetical protein